MSREEGEDKTTYKVIVDHEGQYSIWPADRETALGWSDAGKTGTRAECLAYIEEDLKHERLRSQGDEAEAGEETGGVRGDL